MMLRRLKLQFVAVTVTLTGLVLVGVLGFTLWTTWSTQQDIIEEALERGLRDDLDHMPMMGGRSNGQGGEPMNNMLALAVDVSTDGVIVRSSRSPVVINSSVLAEVVDTALAAEADEGVIPDLHVAWKRAFYTDSSTSIYMIDDWYDESETSLSARVVIVDTTVMDSSFDKQLKGTLMTVVGGLAALVALSWALATWMVRPVARAWDDQKRFVADASHELKTPLAVIVANTEILQHDESLSEESRRWVDSTADEAAHMRSLVGDLLELARTDEGTTTGVMRKEDVDFSETVESAALEFDAIAFERECLIDTDIEEGIHVQGDPEWLERLAKILIDNACKYAEPTSTIEVKLVRLQGKVRLSVRNQGPSIDPEDIAHLFDRFYRSDKARARETGGFGLGLAIAKGIAEAHGGKIAATSTEAEGTTFIVTL